MTHSSRILSVLLLTTLLLAAAAFPTSLAAQEATPASTPVISSLQVIGLGEVDLSGAVASMLTQQADDGGFLGFSGESDPGVTTDAIYALVAAEQAGIDTGDSVSRALTYLETTGAEYAAVGPGQRAKLVLAVVAAGADPFAFGGEDLWTEIENTDFETGVVGGGYFNHSLATLAAVAVGSERVDEFAQRLVDGQMVDGAWAFDEAAGPGEGDTNTTALAVQALAAAGMIASPEIDAALAYFAAARSADGGYGFAPAASPTENIPDANSTALVVQALLAVNTPVPEEPMLGDVVVLASFQNDSGAFQYTDEMPDDNLFATVQAVPAAASVTLPILAEDSLATPAA